MYTNFFGLNEKPFSITPDPRYLYLTQRHADALAHLLYGISESGGFIQLTGEVGTGKTTLIRSLLEQLPERAKIAVVLNPSLSAGDFLQVICGEFHIPLPEDRSNRSMHDALNRFLLREHAENRRVVLVVDEAQTLSVELLEQIRLLTNLETSRHKLLQIILIGQPELRDVLLRPDMRQVAQRITGRYHLEPLGQEETVAYVHHRMKVAGSAGQVFDPSALKEIFRRSHGIPRLINVIADRSLLAAYTLDEPRIGGKLVRSAAAEVFGARRVTGMYGKRIAGRYKWAAAAAVGVLAVGLSAFAIMRDKGPEPMANEQPAQANTPLPVQVAEEVSEPPPATPISGAVARADTSQPAAPTISELLQNTDEGIEDADAFSGLFLLWGMDYDHELGSPCSQAVTSGLRCLILEDGSLPQLRRLNRPTVLSLVDRAGATRYALLDSLDDGEIVVQLGNEAARMTVADLTRHWHGEHTLLWKPGTANARQLVPGERSEGVLWLRNAITRIYGEDDVEPPANDGAASLYDSVLEARVREYQRTHRLQVDGIVGAQTQIALQSALNEPGIPLLSWSH